MAFIVMLDISQQYTGTISQCLNNKNKVFIWYTHTNIDEKNSFKIRGVLENWRISPFPLFIMRTETTCYKRSIEST